MICYRYVLMVEKNSCNILDTVQPFGWFPIRPDKLWYIYRCGVLLKLVMIYVFIPGSVLFPFFLLFLFYFPQ